jgi:hypothetical protein
VSGGPASINNTEWFGFCDSRFAMTHPAEPAPTMIKSYVFKGSLSMPLTMGVRGFLFMCRPSADHTQQPVDKITIKAIRHSKEVIFSVEKEVKRHLLYVFLASKSPTPTTRNS